MDSELYVNSRKVLEWKYGYSTFEADITDFLENGNNEIMVGVHVKHPNSRWYAGAGIYRNVWLKTVHTEHLVSDGIYVSTEEQKDGYQVLVYVETSQAAGTEVQCNLERIEKKLPIRRDGDRAEFSFFLAIPVMLGMSTLKLIQLGGFGSMSAVELISLGIGFAVSFLVALIVVKKFIAFLQKKSMTAFAVYRIGFGLFVLILSICGVVNIAVK